MIVKGSEFMTWEELECTLSQCQKCPLGKTRTNIVIGTGNRNADIMFVGEAPGADEDKTGIPFVGAAGKHLDKLACESDRKFKIKPTLKSFDPCLSGVENKCRQMLEKGEAPYDIAAYCIAYIEATLSEMTKRILEHYGNMPILYAGGVMSNYIISKSLSERFGGHFAPADLSSDNASGNALMCRMELMK